MNYEMKMSENELDRRIGLIMDLPFHKFLDFKVEKIEPGVSKIVLSPSQNIVNAGGVIHGGIIYTMLDSAAYVAMLPLLSDNQNGVTHDIHVTVMNPAPIDEPLILEGEIVKIGKRIVFGDARAYSCGKLVAQGRVTKSIIEIKPLKK